MIFNLQLFSF